MANDQNQNQNPLSEILTEQELCDLLGVKKNFLSNLRLNHKLPFCKVTTTQRVYLAKDVVNFIKSKRMVMDSHE